MIKLAELTKAFSVSRNTVKLWGSEYAEYLSDYANPEPGATRQYTLDDACVLSLVWAMREDNKLTEAIHATLAAGDRGQWPIDKPQEETPEERQETMQLVTQLTARASRLEGRIMEVAEERDMLRDKIDGLQASLMDAEKRASAAAAEAKILKELSDKEPVKRGFWDRFRG